MVACPKAILSKKLMCLIFVERTFATEVEAAAVACCSLHDFQVIFKLLHRFE
jgi:hypothetical protein